MNKKRTTGRGKFMYAKYNRKAHSSLMEHKNMQKDW